jgi:hypothetical protein
MGSMKTINSLIASLILAGAVQPMQASAATIALFNTGVDAAGTPLANGASEQHYVFVTSPTYDGNTFSTTPRVATSANGYPVGPWVGDNLASAWIGPKSDAALDGSIADYVYELTFSLAGLDAATAAITGQWSTDDSGVNILVNGQSTGLSASGYTGFSSFAITSGFIAGTNTLDFIVHNIGGPTGLRVEMSGTAAPLGAVPEPTSWAMMLAGFAMVGIAMRKRARMTIACT